MNQSEFFEEPPRSEQRFLGRPVSHQHISIVEMGWPDYHKLGGDVGQTLVFKDMARECRQTKTGNMTLFDSERRADNWEVAITRPQKSRKCNCGPKL